VKPTRPDPDARRPPRAKPEPEPDFPAEAAPELMSGSVRMVAMIPRDTYQALERASETLNTTKSCVVHLALQQFIATSEAMQFAAKTNLFVKGEGG